MKKLKLRTGIIGVALLGVTTTIVLTSGILSNAPIINSAGSSAVQPLMSSFSNRYPDADLVTQAGGSGAGIRAIIDGTKEIGMASKKPGIIEKPVDNPDRIKWVERKIKTVTIAWDGMGLIYKPKSPDTLIDVNVNTIKNIYMAFSGDNNSETNAPFTFSDIGVTGADANTVISPYARSGGAVVSGTADAFYKDSNLKYDKTPEEKARLDSALIEGQYGKNTTTTSESNSQAWTFVKNENKVGSMVYLSAGFINNNIKEIEANGFKVATYKGVSIDKVNIAKTYNWFRPLNLMISIATNPILEQSGEINEVHSQKLIDWILNSEVAAKIIDDSGYIKLTEQQVLDLMCLNNDIKTFWQATDEMIFNASKPKVDHE